MSTQVEVERPPLPATAEPPGEASAPPETVIAPPRGWQFIDLKELWRFRELIFILAWRDVKVRYKQTVLGAAWAVLQPALMMVVFTIFFSRLAGVKADGFEDKYPLFVYAGLLPWTFFATAVTSAANSVVGSERLITKVYFPRLALPFAAAGAAVVDFLIAFTLLLGLMAWYGVAPGWQILLAPLIFLVLVVAAVAVGTLLAGLYVSYRDFRYVTPFLIQVWMFATPSIYMAVSAAGDGWTQTLLTLNPLTGLVSAFRAACLGGEVPWLSLGVSAAAALLALVGACLYFRRVEDWFADVI
jgi:lipopolysaccharide transport system permease protein